MVKWKIALAYFVLLSTTVQYSEETCYADEDYPYVYFGTKTAYEFVLRQPKSTSVPKCEPIRLWMLSRHGTRYPATEEIESLKSLTDVRDQIVRNHEVNRDGNLCPQDVENFKNWSFDLPLHLSDELTSQGQEELRLRASRLKSDYQSIIDSAYASHRFDFQSTSKKRAVDSAVTFASVLFGSNGLSEIPLPTENDTFLHATKNCPTWEESSRSEEIRKEYVLFKDDKHVKDVLYTISRRLGFKYNITLDVVSNMYDMCRYEKAWYIKSRPAFCAAFSPDDIKVMEYLEDLDLYYKYGYGNGMNKNVVCLLVRDLFEKFSHNSSDVSYIAPSVSLYFSHTNTFLQMLTALGIKYDTRPLMHDSFETMLNREWKSSFIDPFGANLLVVLYGCEDQRIKVMFYLNEKTVLYPGCDVGLCLWDDIAAKFRDFIDPRTCNLDFCNSTSGAFLLRSHYLAISIVIIFILPIVCDVLSFTVVHSFNIPKRTRISS